MTYIVKTDDSLFAIAQKFNVTLSALISANPQIPDPNQIFPGQTLIIPALKPNCPFLRQGDRGPAVKRLQILLRVALFNPGPIDGIFGPRTKIALGAFKRGQKELEMTGVVDEATWVALGAECDPRPMITQYTVRPGESLFIIATRFNISVDSILRVNPQITHPNEIYAGQVIHIPKS
jgi:LysM repeat protein